jgi:hypothetical protein
MSAVLPALKTEAMVGLSFARVTGRVVGRTSVEKVNGKVKEGHGFFFLALKRLIVDGEKWR